MVIPASGSQGIPDIRSASPRNVKLMHASDTGSAMPNSDPIPAAQMLSLRLSYWPAIAMAVATRMQNRKLTEKYDRVAAEV